MINENGHDGSQAFISKSNFVGVVVLEYTRTALSPAGCMMYMFL